MANEVTVPLLPCASIDDIVTFYGVLGFRTTYKQRKPYPCVGLQREDLHLQFFEIAGFDPEQSYGSCHRAHLGHRGTAPGFRCRHAGRIRQSPGVRNATDDPAQGSEERRRAGRIQRHRPGRQLDPRLPEPATMPTPASAPAGRLAKALANAVVLADSKGDVGQAVRILDSALARPQADDDPVTHVEVLVYRAELAMALHDRETATEMLARVEHIALNADETGRAAPTFEIAADLAAALR